MNQGLLVVIGMTVINLFSFAGLIFAWIYYNKHNKNKTETGSFQHEGRR